VKRARKRAGRVRRVKRVGWRRRGRVGGWVDLLERCGGC